MTALSQEARYEYPDRVTDRDPDVGYSVAAWLQPRPAPTDDWLAAAFGVSPEPSLTGRFRVRRAS